MTSPDFNVERKGNIFIITLQKSPENRLTVKFCQDLIRTFHTIQRELGAGSDGAVITRGSDYKFFCTVCQFTLIDHFTTDQVARE
jgi:enoyl-CoA hydratase/carnithine racemase